MNGDKENLYDTGTEIGTNNADEDYTVKLKAVYASDPTAVLYNDGTLIFYEGDPDPADEDIHEGITTGQWYPYEKCIWTGFGSWATEVYDNSYNVPWVDNNKDDIITVQFKGKIKPKSTAHWFEGCVNLETFIPDGLDTSDVIDMQYMFSNCHKLQSFSVETFKTDNVQNISYMFKDCEVITNIQGLDTWNVSHVLDMSYMFMLCYKLQELDLGDWDVSNVSNMDYMFDCDRLQILDLSNWNPEKVESIRFMFVDINRNGSTPAKIYARDWTINPNINNTEKIFMRANVPNFSEDKINGDMCKPQSMGGYFTDPQ